MNRSVPVFILIALLLSCKKKETDLIWEKSYGKGEAYFIKLSSDSGFSSCGHVGGKPYFIKFNKKKIREIELSPEISGLFSSSWSDTSGYVTGGSSDGRMLLMRYSKTGNKLWEKTIDPGFKVDFTRLFYTGAGNILAMGTAGSDLITSEPSGLLFIRFDTTGRIVAEKKITESTSITSVKAALDNSGNIYLALTRKSSGSKSRASVAKYNDQFQKIWETGLFNNPEFASSSLAIRPDASGNVFVAGKTELPNSGSITSNSFLIALKSNGLFSSEWKEKRYLENSNEGSAVIFDDTNNLLMLNRKCFIVNVINPLDGTDIRILRIFSLCVSEDSDAFGTDFDVNYDKNILIAGSFGGNFYLAIKSFQ